MSNFFYKLNWNWNQNNIIFTYIYHSSHFYYKLITIYYHHRLQKMFVLVNLLFLKMSWICGDPHCCYIVLLWIFVQVFSPLYPFAMRIFQDPSFNIICNRLFVKQKKKQCLGGGSDDVNDAILHVHIPSHVMNVCDNRTLSMKSINKTVIESHSRLEVTKR